jgi:hypothetical protein
MLNDESNSSSSDQNYDHGYDAAQDGSKQTGNVDFIITFINNETDANQEHIDYKYTIFDESGNELFNQVLHSTYGVEKANYNFERMITSGRR